MGILNFLNWLRILVPFIVPFTLLVESSGKPGPEKRKEVVRLVMKEMEKLEFEIPSWFERFMEPLVGLLVDVVVNIMNKTGFFEHSVAYNDS